MIETYVKDFARRENCIAGICDAVPLAVDTARFTPFVSRNYLKRTDPAANLPGVKSIIVVGVGSAIKDFPPMPKGAGVLSVLGVAVDYHVVVRALLKKLVDELLLTASFKYKILVDSPTLDERALAVRAGLGFIGLNGLVISREYGSRFNIGVLLTDLPLAQPSAASSSKEGLTYPAPCFEKERPERPAVHTHANACPPNCQNCITACPSRALSKLGGLDAARCISYLTQKDNLTPEEAALMSGHLYGCDICQNVCPMNRPQPTLWANPQDWLSMSDAEFAKAYGHTAMLWRGVALLRRNAGYV